MLEYLVGLHDEKKRELDNEKVETELTSDVRRRRGDTVHNE